MAAIYLLVPAIDAMTMRIRPKVLVAVCLVLMLCFTADMVYSFIHPNKGEGVTSELDMPQPSPQPLEATAMITLETDTDPGRI